MQPRPSCTFQTPSEVVAQSIALQAGTEGSDLLRGGLTHTTLSAYWHPAGRGRGMNTWEVRFSRCVWPMGWCYETDVLFSIISFVAAAYGAHGRHRAVDVTDMINHT